jgi:hypothetical protein
MYTYPVRSRFCGPRVAERCRGAGSPQTSLICASWIPARWYDNMENGNRGRDQIVERVRALARLDIV